MKKEIIVLILVLWFHIKVLYILGIMSISPTHCHSARICSLGLNRTTTYIYYSQNVKRILNSSICNSEVRGVIMCKMTIKRGNVIKNKWQGKRIFFSFFAFISKEWSQNLQSLNVHYVFNIFFFPTKLLQNVDRLLFK